MNRPQKYRGNGWRPDQTTVEPPVHDMRAPPAKPLGDAAPAARPPDRLEPAPANGLVPRPTNAPTPQASPIVRCAYCRSERVRHNGTAGGYKYYRCLRCCDLDTGESSTFKVAIVDPLGGASAVRK